jgi:hypothetical protein
MILLKKVLFYSSHKNSNARINPKNILRILNTLNNDLNIFETQILDELFRVEIYEIESVQNILSKETQRSLT